MNILFLTIVGVNDIRERSLYNDLVRKFGEEGHSMYVVCPIERRLNKKTNFLVEAGVNILRVRTLNFQKSNMLEKGLSTLLLERQFFKAIKSHYSEIKFDLILYTTPPITFTKIIRFFKHRDHAFTYLLLKDIFPQNAVDLDIIKKGGVLERYFRIKEKALYQVSDYIGCMSPANVQYIKTHNDSVKSNRIEVNPNSITPIDSWLSKEDKKEIRNLYSLPADKLVCIYGGNLGKPQGLAFLIEILESNLNNKSVFFLIVGSGTEYGKFKKWFDARQPNNAKLISHLPKKDYDLVLQSCDIGMIFLDRRFTIPNIPSRLLSYLECKIPVIAATDVNTDLGSIIQENAFGFWCENGDLKSFNHYLDTLMENSLLINSMGENGYNFLSDNYRTEHSFNLILNHFRNVH